MNARDFLLAKALGKGSGVSLPTLSSPASASDIYQGTEAIDQAGAVVVGTNPYNASVVDPIKTSALTAIADKGVATTGDETLSEIPSLIEEIQVGGGGSETLNALIDRSITEVNSEAERIGSNVFAGCSLLTRAIFPSCTRIGQSAFASCSSLTDINFPVCSYISPSAFGSCTSLTSAIFPECTWIASYAFWGCRSLESISFPLCSEIHNQAFNGCTSLTSVDFPECIFISTYAFANCTSLTTVNFPVCSYISPSAFSGCQALTSVNFPVCTYINSSAFYRCTSLTSINFPKGLYFYDNVFYSCTSLAIANLPACTSIGNYAFRSCRALSALILSGSSLCKLSNSNAFSGASMIQNGTGYIYVPSSLVDAYKSATNWTYFSNQISAIEDSEFA